MTRVLFPPHDKDFKSHLSRACLRLSTCSCWVWHYWLCKACGDQRKGHTCIWHCSLCAEYEFLPWAKLPFPSFCQVRIVCILLHNHVHTHSQSERKISEKGSIQDSKNSREGWMSGTFLALFPSYHQMAIMYLSKGICVPPTSPNNFW